jgi:hypothetical protein
MGKSPLAGELGEPGLFVERYVTRLCWGRGFSVVMSRPKHSPDHLIQRGIRLALERSGHREYRDAGR